MDAETFNSLLRRLDIGDEEALVMIQKEFGRQIKGMAYSIVNDWQDSTAVLNDVMITLWNKSNKFQNIISPNACIYNLTKKASYTFYRKYIKKHKKQVCIDDIPNNAALIHNDNHSELNYIEMISCLDEIEKEIITMKILFKYTHAEIAHDLKLPESTVKWKYQNILKKLKNKMSEKNLN